MQTYLLLTFFLDDPVERIVMLTIYLSNKTIQPKIEWLYQRGETNPLPPFTKLAIFTTAKVEAACFVVELR